MSVLSNTEATAAGVTTSESAEAVIMESAAGSYFSTGAFFIFLGFEEEASTGFLQINAIIRITIATTAITIATIINNSENGKKPLFSYFIPSTSMMLPSITSFFGADSLPSLFLKMSCILSPEPLTSYKCAPLSSSITTFESNGVKT